MISALRTIRTLLLLLMLTLPCRADGIIRVGLMRVAKPDHVTISCKAGITLDSSRGQQPLGGPVSISVRGRSIELKVDGTSKRMMSVCLRGMSSCPVTIVAGGRIARFRGRLRFWSNEGNLVILNEVGLEDYVRGVVANEMQHDWPAEALKAQAVIARTLAVRGLGAHRSEGFDVCDGSHCQVYRGVSAETPATDAAVRSTAGTILTWHGSPIMSLYSSCCGGITAAAFGAGSLGNTPYLKVQKDTLNGSYACRASPHFDWASAFDAGALASALNTDQSTSPGSHLRDVRVIRYNSSGRAEYLLIDGDRERQVDAYACWNVICRQLGCGGIKSTRFRVAKNGRAYEFRGQGLGHGIGLCQWGALARAKAGWTFSRILAFYYPGAKLSKTRVENTLEKL
jgi:stage II sporulation protein D